MKLTDREGLSQTIRQAQAGDQQAAALLLDVCRSYVHVQAQRHLHSKLAPRVDASDIAQQTLLDAWQGIEGFRGKSTGELVAWLKTIVQRNAIDAARQHQAAGKRALDRELPPPRPSEAETTRLPQELADPTQTPSQRVVQAEEELLLADAIARLPADYQQVLICRSLLRMPFSQVAREMNRSGPAVQMLWARAVEQLRRTLSSRDPDRVQPRPETSA